MNTGASLATELRGLSRRLLSDLGNHVFRETDDFFARHSLVDGGPVLDRGGFPWVDALEENGGAIREELDWLLERRDALPRFQDISPAQKSIARDDRWRVFPLYGFGVRSDRNCAICPRTAAVLDGIPDVIHAFFSVLAPGAHIPRHHGITRGIVRCHLGLIVPERAERCRMEIDGTTLVWREGEAVVFDDTRPHEVWNDTDETRVVLLIDVPRPMTRKGRTLLAMLEAVLERTFYVREAIENELAWERRSGDVFVRRAA